MILLAPGYPYTSKQALAKIAGLNTPQKPHVTPDGRAILAVHAGGGPAVSVDGSSVPQPSQEWQFVVLAESGLNLEHVVDEGGLKVKTVFFPVDAFSDVQRLVEYDHLPESRKDYKVYPRGHKLA